MRAAIPNALTILRLALTAAVIAILSIYDHPEGNRWALPLAAGLFIVAALTDALDGYLARRWKTTSAFGRVMDPFADKALVLGSFIVLAGAGFAEADGSSASGVAPWMAVIILVRELLVTSVRGSLEGAGVAFPATWSGKAKMILQSVAVPAVLVLLWLGAEEARAIEAWARRTIDIVIWMTVLVTLISAWPYMRRAAEAIANQGEG